MLNASSILWPLAIATLLPQAQGLSLQDHSPFLPPNYQEEAIPKESVAHKSVGNLRFTGVYAINGRTHVFITNTQSGTSNWVHAASDQGMILLAFDTISNTCTIQLANGSTQTIPLENMPETNYAAAPASLTAEHPAQISTDHNKALSSKASIRNSLRSLRTSKLSTDGRNRLQERARTHKIEQARAQIISSAPSNTSSSVYSAHTPTTLPLIKGGRLAAESINEEANAPLSFPNDGDPGELD